MLTLADVLGELLGTRTRSFQAMGEDLALLPGARLSALGAAWQAELERTVPAALQARFIAAQAAAASEAHRWLRRHNRSLNGRIAGYLALGERVAWEYPWPVVAILGLCQVLSGVRKNRLYGALGAALARASSKLELLVDLSDDTLRRTNRGIFADSVPTVLYAMHAHDLRRAGDTQLADALLAGPLPPLMDDDTRALARGLYDGLAIPDADLRFTTLAALTLRHFEREQSIFSHHLGPPRRPPAPPGLLDRVFALRDVPAPAVVGGRLVFRDYLLPAGFDIHDHAARVAAFGQAFVASVTASRADHAVARAWVQRRFATGTRPGPGPGR